jgi:lipopolysaccharide/colanic/teichoic acid biosynthesis glycosyltransferase
VALVVLIPLFLVVAALILICDGRPIFYGHRRIGRGGVPFRCLKFRTMVRDADDRLNHLLATDPAARREWNRTRKLKRDPRILPFGQLLRALSIDELPQFLNVLRGEMSLVGPRPITRDELRAYGAAARAYMSVRPGVTGPWQVSGRSALSFEERIRIDTAYVAQRSLRGDLRILLRTPAAVLGRSGAC